MVIEPSTLAAWWGATFSTVLTILKVLEFWRDRFQLDVSYNFTGDENIGNQVLIRNLSARAFILSDWELLYGTGRWPRRKFKTIEHCDHDVGDIRIDPHTTHTLRFAEERHFSWDNETLRGRKIYIRLHIAGHKPILRVVYSQ
jgi:hypothetical protein